MSPENQPIVPILDMNKNLSGLMGLTKKEYFAGLAMQGMLAGNLNNRYGSFEEIIEASIDISERLIKQLN